MKVTKCPAKKVLEELDSAVEDIIDEFGWLGFSQSNEVPSEVKQAGQGDGDNIEESAQEIDELTGEDFEFEPYKTFDREEIEVGVDQLISRMIKKKFVKKEKIGSQPTLWRVFTAFYDESHPIIELVDSFELHIKGYFGTIEYGEMRAAFENVLQIQGLIRSDLGASGD